MRKSLRLALLSAACLTLWATESPAQLFQRGVFQRGRINLNNDPAVGPQRGRVNVSGSQSSQHSVTVSRRGILGRPHTTTVTSGPAVGAFAAAPAAALSTGYAYHQNVAANQLLAPAVSPLVTNRLNTFTTTPYVASANLGFANQGAAYLTAPLALAAAPVVQQYTYTATATAPVAMMTAPAPLVAAAPAVPLAATAPLASVTHTDTTCSTTAGAPAALMAAPQALAAPGGCYHANPAALLQNRQYQSSCTTATQPVPTPPVPATP